MKKTTRTRHVAFLLITVSVLFAGCVSTKESTRNGPLTLKEQGIFRMGVGTEFYPGVQFAKDPATLGQFYRHLRAQQPMSTTNLPGKPTGTELSAKQQSIAVIAALTAKGELQKLQLALNSGLDAGLTGNEIKEVLVHLYAYCGFPRSIRGLQTLMTVLDERKKRGITDKMGREASPITGSGSKYERGKKVLEQLTGRPESGPKRGYAAFSPEIEVFLKEHLFADIFERDVLSYADRELTTISVLTSIGGVEPMLQSHLGICLHVGLTEPQLKQALSLIGTAVGSAEAEAGRAVLTQVLAARR